MTIFNGRNSDNKGFTLMEVLAVLLVIAVIVGAAAPVFRSTRYEIRNAQAKAALKKLGEAYRSYYQYSRGQKAVGSFHGSTIAGERSLDNPCENPAGTGVPSQSVGRSAGTVGIEALFQCGFLSFKDFRGIPYNFEICDDSAADYPCTQAYNAGSPHPAILAYSEDAEMVGEKYRHQGRYDGYLMFIDNYMQVQDVNEGGVLDLGSN